MFTLTSTFSPKGDQPKAIAGLVSGIDTGYNSQALLGVTGSGKTFTMASVIHHTGLPTLIISPNKTLAAQLYQEFKQFFPHNAVHYFVSYYDYYQPEAFLPHSNTYIQKDARINEEIDALRHAAIQSVLSRRDCIIISSVSCIYGIGDPTEYQRARLEMKVGQRVTLADLSRHLNFLQYEKVSKLPSLGQFHIEIDRITIHLVTDDILELRVAKKKIVSVTTRRPRMARVTAHDSFLIYPSKFWVTPQKKMKLALRNIKSEMGERVEELQSANRFVEAERIEKRTLFDLEMLNKKGYVNGIENYSRHLSFREPGEPPMTLLDYFPKPFLLFLDESHIAVPQLNAMYAGDRQRKSTLVHHGFRLPSALDNRPLTFGEFNARIGQTVYVSATPGPYEMEKAEQIVEQLVRPTGILDPEIVLRPAKAQVHDLYGEIVRRVAKNERVLALTLTKRSAEDLTEYLLQNGIRAQYLHSEIKTLKRTEILAALRRGEYDVLVGVNLLREGLDLPEVTLVAILDADREGFLRNYRGIMQMAGRAARSLAGTVILYADTLTESMHKVLTETTRRRAIQQAHNKTTGVTPTAIHKPILESQFIRSDISA